MLLGRVAQFFVSVASQTTTYYKGIASRVETHGVKVLRLEVRGMGSVTGVV